MKIHKKLTSLLISASAIALLGVPVFAITPGSDHASAEGTTGETQANEAAGANAKGQSDTRLSAAKARVCQNRERVINNILARIADRGQKQLDLFTTIATRTENFYTEKGKTLSNYADLVAQVDAKKAAAETAVAAVKADSGTFNCDSADPKGTVAGFKAALQSEIAVLKDYKTAVKNLIVGVKSVQGTTSSTDAKTTTTTTTGGNE